MDLIVSNIQQLGICRWDKIFTCTQNLTAGTITLSADTFLDAHPADAHVDGFWAEWVHYPEYNEEAPAVSPAILKI